MELYLLFGLCLIYLITSFILPKNHLQRIWTLAFFVCFAVTAISIGLIKFSGQDVMMSASELNWYYLLYLFGTLSVVLGLINLWLYRRGVWHIFFGDDEDDDTTDIEENNKKADKSKRA